VDLARLKSEFLYLYQQRHGASLRSRLLGSAQLAAVWGSRFAPVSNWIMRSHLSRWLGEKLLGVDCRRTLPEFSRGTFTDWWKRRSRTSEQAAQADLRPVAVFADTFTNHYEPQHGTAMVRLAEKLGARVLVPPRVCCGRPLISKGFLAQARQRAAATVQALFSTAAAGVPIVFLEPGCYSAVRDDHPLLLRGKLQEQARVVSAACLTCEEWAESALASARGGLARFEDTGTMKILLHGHCHQKALVGVDPAVRLLSRIPGSEVSDADSGCCGMAGSFGYEREHYAISQAVGERKLFRAVREAGPGTVVVAPGFSCRQQIRHFTGVGAVSALELVAPLIEGSNSKTAIC